MNKIPPVNPQVSFKGNDKPNYENDFLKISKNRILDAGAWGLFVGGVSTGVDCFMQKREMKNPERIKELATELLSNLADSKNAQKIAKTLECYKGGKIDWAKAGKTGVLFGVIFTFIPQLVFNYLIPVKQEYKNK